MHRHYPECWCSILTFDPANNAILKIEWAIEQLYNSVGTGSQWVGDQMSWRRCGRESHRPAERGPRYPRLSWRSQKLKTRCGRESYHPAEGAFGTPSEFGDQLVRRCWDENMSQWGWAPGPRLSSPGEQERHTAMSGGAGEVSMLQSLLSLQLPLTNTNLSNKVRGIFF